MFLLLCPAVTLYDSLANYTRSITTVELRVGVIVLVRRRRCYFRKHVIIIRWYDWASSIGWSEAKSFHNRSSHTHFDFASLFSLYVIQCAYYCPHGMFVAFDELILIDILWWARVCASCLYDCITPGSHSYQLQYNIHLPACAWTSRIMYCVHIFQVFHWTIKIYGVFNCTYFLSISMDQLICWTYLWL